MSTLQENISPSNEPATRLDDDLKKIRDAKYDVGLESDVCTWIGQIICRTKPTGEAAAVWLKSGDALCELMNAIRPGTIKKYNVGTTSKFKQMENITIFLRACREVGMLEKDLFSTVDLFEGKDMNAVILSLFNLGGTIQSTIPYFKGPKLGIKQNNRKFQVVPPLVEAAKPAAPAARAPIVEPITDLAPVVIPKSVVETVPLPQVSQESVIPTIEITAPVTTRPVPIAMPVTINRDQVHKDEPVASVRVTLPEPFRTVLSPPVRAEAETPLATVKSIAAARAPLSPKDPNSPSSPSAGRSKSIPPVAPAVPVSIEKAEIPPAVRVCETPVANTRSTVVQSQQDLDIKPRRRTPLSSKQIINATRAANTNQPPQPAPMALTTTGSAKIHPQQIPQQILAPPVAIPQVPMLFATPGPITAKPVTLPTAYGQYQSYGSNLLRQISNSQQPNMMMYMMQPQVAPQPVRQMMPRRHIMPGNETSEMIEQSVVEWIEAVLGESKPMSFSLHQWLRTGEVLCRFANAILAASPNPHIRIQTIARATDTIMQQRENARRFVDICRALGVSQADLFSTTDLFYGQNMQQVIMCVFSLGGILQNYEWWVKSNFALLGRRLRIQTLNKVSLISFYI